jgi:hypothetical protein
LITTRDSRGAVDWHVEVVAGLDEAVGGDDSGREDVAGGRRGYVKVVQEYVLAGLS